MTFDISSMKRQLTDSLDSFCRMRNEEAEDEQDDMRMSRTRMSERIL